MRMVCISEKGTLVSLLFLKRFSDLPLKSPLKNISRARATAE
jgi:hypothetical protein